MSVFSERLKKVMDDRGVTQAQLCAMTDIPKSAMTQYLAACFEPRRRRLDIICRALDVNQSWLIGFSDYRSTYGAVSEFLSEEEQHLISAYREDPIFKGKIEELLWQKDSAEIFRAAKSEDGKIAPARKLISGERIKRLIEAPETDEDL